MTKPSTATSPAPTSHRAPDQPGVPKPGDGTTTSTPVFEQLKRAPVVPEAVLRRHHAYCAIDTRFRAAARLQQALWLKSRNVATAVDLHPDADSFLGSMLSHKAARAGKNFLSLDIHQLAIQETLFCEPDAAIDPERLMSNALTSMALCMNLIGPLRLNHDLATAVFRILFPDFVHTVQAIQFEHTPSGRDREDPRWLMDRSAVDFAVHATSPDGEPGIIYGEIKLSEATMTAARMRDRYGEASHQVRLYCDPDSSTLRSVAIEQLWREHMLAQLAVDNGVTPRALFTAIAPQLNRNAQVAFKLYEAELLDVDQREPDRVAFAPLTLETFIRAIAQAGAHELAQALWGRYCDLGPVVHLAMQEYAADDIPSSIPEQTPALCSKTPPPPPVTARRAKQTARRGNTNSASAADGETPLADISNQAVAS